MTRDTVTGDGKADIVHVWGDGLNVWKSRGDGQFDVVSEGLKPRPDYGMNPLTTVWMVGGSTRLTPQPVDPPATQPPGEPATTKPPVLRAQVPATIVKATIRFPKRRKAVLIWPTSSGADRYRVRISMRNSNKKFRPWATVTSPTAAFTGLRKRGKYVVQITPVGPGGTGATAAFRFKQKR